MWRVPGIGNSKHRANVMRCMECVRIRKPCAAREARRHMLSANTTLKADDANMTHQYTLWINVFSASASSASHIAHASLAVERDMLREQP